MREEIALNGLDWKNGTTAFSNEQINILILHVLGRPLLFMHTENLFLQLALSYKIIIEVFVSVKIF